MAVREEQPLNQNLALNKNVISLHCVNQDSRNCYERVKLFYYPFGLVVKKGASYAPFFYFRRDVSTIF